MLAEITLDRVEIPDGRRAIDPDAVARLKNSIAVVGLQHPITVAKRDGGYRLLAGAHRLTAFRELGMERISANIVELDDLHAELVELDENLARNELSAAERSLAVARQPRVWSPDAGLHRLPYELASFSNKPRSLPWLGLLFGGPGRALGNHRGRCVPEPSFRGNECLPFWPR